LCESVIYVTKKVGMMWYIIDVIELSSMWHMVYENRTKRLLRKKPFVIGKVSREAWECEKI